MRRFRLSQFDQIAVDQIAVAQHLWKGQRDSMPAPFPGRWPTRIAWRVESSDGRKASYIGKPIAQAARQFQALSSLPQAYDVCYLVEFDRKHWPIYLWSIYTGTVTHPSLWGVYHYWQAALSYANYLTGPNYFRRLGGLPIYCPFRALSSGRKQDWRQFVLSQTSFKPEPIPEVPELP